MQQQKQLWRHEQLCVMMATLQSRRADKKLQSQVRLANMVADQCWHCANCRNACHYLPATLKERRDCCHKAVRSDF